MDAPACEDFLRVAANEHGRTWTIGPTSHGGKPAKNVSIGPRRSRLRVASAWLHGRREERRELPQFRLTILSVVRSCRESWPVNIEILLAIVTYHKKQLLLIIITAVPSSGALQGMRIFTHSAPDPNWPN